MKERNLSIDAMRFVAAVLVVCLHTGLPEKKIWATTVLFIARSAVPLFFMISGYMFAMRKKWDQNMDLYVRKQQKKIAQVAFAGLIFYMMVDILRSGPKTVLWVTFHPKSILEFLLFNNVWYGGHLWYLFAYLYVLFVYQFLIKRDRVKWMYYWIPFGLIGYAVLGKYSKLILGTEVSYMCSRNFLMAGIPCFAIGHWLAQGTWKSAEKNKNLERAAWIGLMVIEVGMLWAERNFLKAHKSYVSTNNFIANTLLGVTALIFALRFPGNKPWVRKIAYLGKKYSMTIYILHMFMKRCVTFVFKWVDVLAKLIEDPFYNQVYRALTPVFCVTGCIIAKIAWDYVKKIAEQKKAKN
ncbi:MAG: acyltransferase [Lachnospiraceae bacterium]|nr:acyltransferase [Robinsoniella sp.]MDY3765506.1 acyltransferase [Lachnospiraceae bacterium]